MTSDPAAAAGRAAELRRVFDQSFALPVSAGTEVAENLMEIRLAGTIYAVRVAEIGGLFADVRITFVPSAVPELLGIGGFRGAILPVYDLRALLGQPGEASPRWVIVAAAVPVALAFGGFERQISVGREAIVPEAGGGTSRHVRDVVRLDGGVRPVLSIASVLEAITIRVRSAGSKEE
jgi:chemotaxis signal transduction protein